MKTVDLLPKAAAPVEVVACNLGPTWAIALNSTHVLVAAETSVLAAPKGGGPLQVIASNQTFADAVFADEVAAYWTSAGIFSAPFGGGAPAKLYEPSSSIMGRTASAATLF